MRLKPMLGGLALVVAIVGPALAADKIKIGYITKFPVPYFQTMEDAAKAWAKAHPDVEIVYGQGKIGDRYRGPDCSHREHGCPGCAGHRNHPGRSKSFRRPSTRPWQPA